MSVSALLGVFMLGSGIFQWKILRCTSFKKHPRDPEKVRCVKEVTYVVVTTSSHGGEEEGGCDKIAL